MTPDQVAARVRELAGPEAACVVEHGEAVVDVPRERWVDVVSAVRDDAVLALVLFDLLTAVDEQDRGFDVVLRLWSPHGRHGLRLRTRCPREDARVPSLAGAFAGADWHERETWEMFGLVFDGHPGLLPLLLPDGFEGTPLRKDFVLASRVVKEWPGAKDPGEGDQDLRREREQGRRPRTRRPLPPGVPRPGSWGPA